MASDRLLDVYKGRNCLWDIPVLPYVPLPLEEILGYWRQKDFKDNCIKNVYTVGILELTNGLWAKLHSTIEANKARMSLDVSQIPEALAKESTYGKMLRLGKPARVFGTLEVREREMVIVVERMLPVTDVESCLRTLRLASKVAERRVSRYRYDFETSAEIILNQIWYTEGLRKRFQERVAKMREAARKPDDGKDLRKKAEERRRLDREEKEREERRRLEKEEEERRNLSKEEEERRRLKREERDSWLLRCWTDMEKNEDYLRCAAEAESAEMWRAIREEQEAQEREIKKERRKMEKRRTLRETMEAEEFWRAENEHLWRRMMNIYTSKKKTEDDLRADVVVSASEASAR